MIFLDQGAELAFVIENEVIFINFLNFCMVSGNTYVSHPNFTLMTSPNFDAVTGNVLDDHHIVGFFRDAFQHDVLSGGFFDWHEFIFGIIFLDETRILFFANLAVEFLEIVLDCSTNHLFLHF